MSPLSAPSTEQLKRPEQQATPEMAATRTTEQRLAHVQETITSLSTERQALSERFDALTAPDLELGTNEDAEERDVKTEAQLIHEALRQLDQRLRAAEREASELKAQLNNPSIETNIPRTSTIESTPVQTKEQVPAEHIAQASQLYESFTNYMSQKYGAEAATAMTAQEKAFGDKLKRSASSTLYNLPGLQEELDRKKQDDMMESLDATTNAFNAEFAQQEQNIANKKDLLAEAQSLSKAVFEKSAEYSSISDDEAAHFDDAAKKKEDARAEWTEKYNKLLELFKTTDGAQAEQNIQNLKTEIKKAEEELAIAKEKKRKPKAEVTPQIQPDVKNTEPPSLAELVKTGQANLEAQKQQEKLAAERAEKEAALRAELQKNLEDDTEYRTFIDGEYDLSTIKGMVDTGKKYSFKDVINGRYKDDASYILNQQEKEIEERLKQYAHMPPFTDSNRKSEWLAEKSMLEKMHIDAIQTNFNFQEKILPEYIAKIQAQKKAIEDKHLAVREKPPEKPASPPPLPTDFQKTWPVTPDKPIEELIQSLPKAESPTTQEVVEISPEDVIAEPDTKNTEAFAFAKTQEIPVIKPQSQPPEIPKEALKPKQEQNPKPSTEPAAETPTEAQGSFEKLPPDAQFLFQERLNKYEREVSNAEAYLTAAIARSFDGTYDGRPDVDYAQKNLAYKKAQQAYNTFAENLYLTHNLINEKGGYKPEIKQFFAAGEELKGLNVLGKAMDEARKALDASIKNRKQARIQENHQAVDLGTASTQAFNMGPVGAKSEPYQVGPVDPARSKEFQMTPPSNQSKLEQAATIAIENPLNQKNSPA